MDVSGGNTFNFGPIDVKIFEKYLQPAGSLSTTIFAEATALTSSGDLSSSNTFAYYVIDNNDMTESVLSTCGDYGLSTSDQINLQYSYAGGLSKVVIRIKAGREVLVRTLEGTGTATVNLASINVVQPSSGVNEYRYSISYDGTPV